MESCRLGDLQASEIERCLLEGGLTLQVASFRSLIHSDTGRLAVPLRLLYQDYPASTVVKGFYDFRINLKKRSRFWREDEVEFEWAGNKPFPPLPISQTHPMFEWGLNWCMATLSACHTVIHSAVVERNGRALVLPGAPGSGKSTLCAALALSGWRLMSDELTIVSQKTGMVEAIPRPISLKGDSIELVKSRFPLTELTPPITDTRKGAIAYVRPPVAAIEGWPTGASIGCIVFPRFKASAALTIEPVSRAIALAELMENTFNVGLLGASGFEALAMTVDGADCYAVEYSDLSEIVQWVDATCR